MSAKRLREAADAYEYALANGHEPPAWIWGLDFSAVKRRRACPRGEQDLPLVDVDEYGAVTRRAPEPGECSPRALVAVDPDKRPSLDERINARGYCR